MPSSRVTEKNFVTLFLDEHVNFSFPDQSLLVSIDKHSCSTTKKFIKADFSRFWICYVVEHNYNSASITLTAKL